MSVIDWVAVLVQVWVVTPVLFLIQGVGQTLPEAGETR